MVPNAGAVAVSSGTCGLLEVSRDGFLGIGGAGFLRTSMAEDLEDATLSVRARGAPFAAASTLSTWIYFDSGCSLGLYARASLFGACPS